MTYKGFSLRLIKRKGLSRCYVVAQKGDKIIIGDWQDTKDAAVADVKAKIDQTN